MRGESSRGPESPGTSSRARYLQDQRNNSSLHLPQQNSHLEQQPLLGQHLETNIPPVSPFQGYSSGPRAEGQPALTPRWTLWNRDPRQSCCALRKATSINIIINCSTSSAWICTPRKHFPTLKPKDGAEEGLGDSGKKKGWKNQCQEKAEGSWSSGRG